MSDRTGGEEGHKFLDYARIGVPFYVIFDPENRLGQGVLRAFIKQGKKYAVTNPACFEEIGLGLVLWDGPYEGQDWHWLRWCDRDGRLIPNAAERIAQEREYAEREAERATGPRTRTRGDTSANVRNKKNNGRGTVRGPTAGIGRQEPTV